MSRDGKTPEEVTKQILQIHAILPGQKPDRQFNIPSRTNSLKPTRTNEPAATHQQPIRSDDSSIPSAQLSQMSLDQSTQNVHPVQLPQTNPTLGSQPSESLTANHIVSHQTSSNSFPPKDSSTPHDQSVSSQTVNLSPEQRREMDQSLPPSKLLNSNPQHEPTKDDLVMRRDSEGEVDEFHDAQS